MAPRTLTQEAREARVDWARVRATTDEEIDRQAREDETDSELSGLAYPRLRLSLLAFTMNWSKPAFMAS